MIKDIKYNGITAVPSDYECPDGDLEYAINLFPDNGELRPIQTPQTLFHLPSTEYSIFFIHRGNGYINYILRRSDSLYWLRSADATGTISPGSLNSIGAFTGICGINSIGNTLIVLTSEGMKYLLWKNDNYTYLGTHIPEMPISFSLQGEMERSDKFDVSFDNIDALKDRSVWERIIIASYDITPALHQLEFSDENKKKITDQVLAKVNKFIADKSTNAGKFIFPFFVRYAYRLYDQSLVMHSAPVLMTCASGVTPACFVNSVRIEDQYVNGANLQIAAMTHKLDYAVKEQAFINNLSSWKDIVKSVDIFISKPLYTYNQNGECQRFVAGLGSKVYSVCKHINQAASKAMYPLQYQTASFSWLYAKTFDPESLKCPEMFIELPGRDDEAIKADLTDNAQFYLLKSIPIEDLKTTRTVIPIGKEYLQSLVNREVMTDDYDSHDTLIPKLSFSYNSRINIANLTKRLFTGHHTYSLFQYTDGYVGNFGDGTSPTYFNNIRVSVEVFVYVRQDGKEFVLDGGKAAVFGYKTKFLYLFCANEHAYKALIRIASPFTKCYEVPLTPHPMLNGAFYFGDWEGVENSALLTNESPHPTYSNIVHLPNKIYTSEVNNPFYFPALGINTVGTGTIYGICAAVRALSQGQFGQFPLYVFTDEGVWSLEVSAQGTYKSRQPVTRDVCANPESITQTDSEVLFISQRGIMLLSGSNCTCISDVLDTEDAFDIMNLPGMQYMADETVMHAKNMNVVFRDFLTQAKMLYDYANQRVIVYNPGISFAYVYSLKSHKWGTIAADYTLKSGINSYPDTLAMNNRADVLNMSKSEMSDITPIHTLIVTRPVKLGEPDVLKTVNVVIQRGMFHLMAVSQMLYGSRDLINWHLVYSSEDDRMAGVHGTPYKYFRIVALCSLYKNETISGCTIQYVQKQTNRLR